jgi:hypothetical protein
MSALQQVATSGHNMPPTELEIVRQRLADEERGIRAALASVNKEPLPEIIENDLIAGQVTDRIKTLRNIIGGVEKAHKAVKAPFLECGRAADAWKNGLESEIDALRKLAEKPLSAFLAKKAEEERVRQLEVARQQREEADRLAAEAAAHQAANISEVASELLDAAVKSEALAIRIERNITYAAPSDLAKSRSITGSTSSQKTAWVARIVSLRGIDLEVLRPYLNEDAIQKALNAFVKNGGRECSGAQITEEVTGLNIR